ncbi:solute carrier family 2, facilitated glucose transporter member 1-like isoform X1 [Myzus persicae]|uniref:solute carrier family 2, facilitated glucose transporter member 1-like isoform X1 n=2 Tax=Myzus persicae TaxID=13164 RepID=UPI000B939A89|nr:solute carrier family 2, facilitated glucose transporter member 1-like isoform X1 [Myzus persicae]
MATHNNMNNDDLRSLLGTSNMENEMIVNKDNYNENKELGPNYLLGDQEHIDKTTKVSWILVITTISTSLGCSIPAGYNTGVVNAPAEVLKQWCNETIMHRYAVQFSSAQLDGLWSILVSIFLIGGIIGGVAGGKLANVFGRKGTLQLIYLINLVSGILFFSSKSLASVELFFIARLLSGLSAGLTMAMVPMYLLELSPANKSGLFGVMFTVGLNFGVVLSQFLGLGNILGNESSWHYLFSLYGGWVLLALPTLKFIPESPKYLYTVRNEHSKALSELSNLRGKPISDIRWELENLLVSPERWTLRKVISEPSSRKAIIITCIVMLGQQLSGINAVFYYSTSIFRNAGMSTAGAQYGNLSTGVINFIVTILSTTFIDNFGRKTLLLFSSTICVFMLTALMTSMILSSIGTIPGISYLLILFVIGYVLFYGFGLGPIPFFIGSELTDVGPRPIIMSAMSVANWSGNFLVGLAFPFVNLVLKQYSFLPFIVFTVFLIIFTWKVVPETKQSFGQQSADSE